jgi:uncharacterized protein YkwD
MRRGLTMMAVCLLAGLCAAQPAPSPVTLSPEQQLFKLLNLERQHHGLTLFHWDSRLAEAAKVHAQKMARAGYISHRYIGEPDLRQRAASAGALFKSVAENVALAGAPEEIHLALMNSAGHRANILNPDYNAVGIGAAQVNNELYVTEDFALVVPAYSADQFRQGVVSAFNKLRQARRLRAISARSDKRLDQVACSRNPDLGPVLAEQPGAASAITFNAVQPWDLPAEIQKSAVDSTLQRMNLGVCFRPDPASNFAPFWVIAVFFPGRQSGQSSTGPILPVTR